MKKCLAFSFALLVSVLVPFAAGQKKETVTNARGKYLVENVGLCADCHTPRDQNGEPIKSQWLMGAPIMFKSTVPIPWAEQAPQIAGLPSWTRDVALKLLMTGIDANGRHPRPPMPEYRFNRQDAQAVVDYLQALGSSK